MIDLEMMNAFLQAIPRGARLVLTTAPNTSPAGVNFPDHGKAHDTIIVHMFFWFVQICAAPLCVFLTADSD